MNTDNLLLKPEEDVEKINPMVQKSLKKLGIQAYQIHGATKVRLRTNSGNLSTGKRRKTDKNFPAS